MHSAVGSDLVLATCENKGFSLLDLLIVIMILGILGVFLAPQLHSTLNEARLNEATGELVSGLHYAQSLAVTHQRPFGLSRRMWPTIGSGFLTTSTELMRTRTTARPRQWTAMVLYSTPWTRNGTR